MKKASCRSLNNFPLLTDAQYSIDTPDKNSPFFTTASFDSNNNASNTNSLPPSTSTSPVRKIKLRRYEEQGSKQKLGAGIKRGRQSSKIVSKTHGDLNPLNPCGSCQEWLKKIAEPNPDFKVITFTDENCEGVYVNNVLN